ncbi:unnamed protein product [Rhizoctonia solani]|uniref:Uncharacterized protein n=1 Tax=Rhizoctonia solani TaxID=456999 RepID=A0A8H3EA21_9AGAM|nr:unnamed protein product [Rhizoctonia solani]
MVDAPRHMFLLVPVSVVAAVLRCGIATIVVSRWAGISVLSVGHTEIYADSNVGDDFVLISRFGVVTVFLR